MSLEGVDTLNLLAEKLENLFSESQGYYESFLDANNLYKNGKISEKEFFAKMGDYTVAYSALEFLAVKVILELKKAIQKSSLNESQGVMQPSSQMPGMVNPAMTTMGMGQAPRIGTADAPVGAPPRIVSAEEGFSAPGTLPAPDPALMPRRQITEGGCASCGARLRDNAKFCTKCGSKV